MRARFEHPGGGVRVEVAIPKDRPRWLLGACSAEVTERPERRSDPDRPEEDIFVLTFRTVDHAWTALAALADRVQVIGPPEVRDELVRLAEATLQRYRGAAPAG
jgi:predicted DNA-binding transcriptional regulator YafY